MRTTKVRIRAHVWPDGYWTAAGDSAETAETVELWVIEQGDYRDPHTEGLPLVVWIEADVPVPEKPEPQAVPGEVVP